jgi:hypothetical protein
MLSKIYKLGLLGFIVVLLTPTMFAKQRPRGARRYKWVVLVYVNGRNGQVPGSFDTTLEAAAKCTLAQLLSTTLNRNVAVVAQVGFIGNGNETTTTPVPECPSRTLTPYWGGVRRFRVRAGWKPQEPLGQSIGAPDMTQPSTLSDFVASVLHQYKGDHYALIMKDHGRGWPFLKVARGTGCRECLSLARNVALGIPNNNSEAFKRRAIYSDPDNNLEFNVRIREALAGVLGHRRLDILGFDACYKALVETGYAMSGVAREMISSEETVQITDAWNYVDWLNILMKDPSLNRHQFTQIIIASFRKKYQDQPNAGNAELSALNLDSLPSMLDGIDKVSEYLIGHKQLWDSVKQARDRSNPYDKYDIDMIRFLNDLAVTCKDNSKLDLSCLKLTKKIQAVKRLFSSSVNSYGGPNTLAVFGSHGLAIYFPAELPRPIDDPNFTAYDPDNENAIPFAKEHLWACFIKAYLHRSSQNAH